MGHRRLLRKFSKITLRHIQEFRDAAAEVEASHWVQVCDWALRGDSQALALVQVAIRQAMEGAR
jgi:hypothetical protein